MPRPAQIAVCGASEGTAELAGLAERTGALLAGAGARVVCGGHGGVMEAVARGAAGAGGEVIGILPGEELGAANEFVTHPIATGVGHARNLAVVASSDAVIVLGGAWGTLSELALARIVGRGVVLLRAPAGAAPASAAGEEISEAGSPEEAVELALRLAAKRTEPAG